MKYAIGVDIGGTKISIVLGDERGKILTRREITTQTGAKTRACVKELVANLSLLTGQSGIFPKKILGIGVGCPGAVNSQKGILPRSPNLPGWAGVPLRSILKKATGLPVFLGNDANVAALGEHRFGAGKGTRNFIYMTVSTGVGGGFIVNGQLCEGASGAAGEIGHISVVPEGNKCACGKRGCLEAYASGTAIGKTYREVARKRIAGAKEVGAAACSGDKTAIESYRRAGYYLGLGIANLLNILNPEMIVIGGGVMKSAHKIFWRSMIKSARQHAWPETFSAVRILKTQITGHVGDLGALALVFENLEKRARD